MKTLYLDCSMGAAGDMITAALIELLPDPDAFVEKVNSLGIPKVVVSYEKVNKRGITGTQFNVKVDGVDEEEVHEHHHEHSHDHGHEHSHEHEHHHDHHHEHRSMEDIRHIVMEHLNLPVAVAEDVMGVYSVIAEAESHVHGVSVSDIHFHEVGTMDAIADIASTCLAMAELAPEEIIVSPVHVGYGTVHCAHGILPVPAPATAYILQGVPIYGGEVRGELCTPTGAALLKHFAHRFSPMPLMTVSSIGYGMGKKDFGTAGCLRAMLGETTEK